MIYCLVLQTTDLMTVYRVNRYPHIKTATVCDVTVTNLPAASPY